MDKAYGVGRPGDQHADGGRHAHPHRVDHQDVHRHVLLQLAEEGKISLDDPIDKYVAGVSRTAIASRCACWPNMTTGVAELHVQPEVRRRLLRRPRDKVITPDEVLAIGISEPAMFEPGAEYFYSNTNTGAAGQGHREGHRSARRRCVQERIFEPLGLRTPRRPANRPSCPSRTPRGTRCRGDRDARQPERRHQLEPGVGLDGRRADLDHRRPVDLRARARHRPRPARAGDAGRAPHLVPGVDRLRYGLGMGCVDGWVGHVGELPGYNSSVYHDTDDRHDGRQPDQQRHRVEATAPVPRRCRQSQQARSARIRRRASRSRCPRRSVTSS